MVFASNLRMVREDSAVPAGWSSVDKLFVLEWRTITHLSYQALPKWELVEKKVMAVSEAGPVMKSLVQSQPAAALSPPSQSWAAMSSVSYWWGVTGKLQDSGVLSARRCFQHLRSSQDG